jgi:hypothetical protein
VAIIYRNCESKLKRERGMPKSIEKDGVQAMESGRRVKRTNLFLVRVWVEEEQAAGEAGTGSDAGKVESAKTVCKGSVQRVVNGELYRFEDLQGLPDVLAQMLSLPSGKPGADSSGPAAVDGG